MMTKTMNISIVIVSCKEKIATLNSLNSCPVPYEVIISRGSGLSRCRNNGVRKAVCDLIVMFDDDIKFNSEIWSRILNIKEGEFAMTFLADAPCTRVVSIYAKDFWSINGFNEKIRFTGEDQDFYIRAIKHGLKFKLIPISLIHHFEHPPRCKNIYVGIGSVKENMWFFVRYWRHHPKLFKISFLNRFKRGQIRTLFLQFIFLIYYIAKGIEK